MVFTVGLADLLHAALTLGQSRVDACFSATLSSRNLKLISNSLDRSLPLLLSLSRSMPRWLELGARLTHVVIVNANVSTRTAPIRLLVMASRFAVEFFRLLRLVIRQWLAWSLNVWRIILIFSLSLKLHYVLDLLLQILASDIWNVCVVKLVKHVQHMLDLLLRDVALKFFLVPVLLDVTAGLARRVERIPLSIQDLLLDSQLTKSQRR